MGQEALRLGSHCPDNRAYLYQYRPCREMPQLHFRLFGTHLVLSRPQGFQLYRAASQGTALDMVPPPGLLSDLLRAVPHQSPVPQIARPKSVFWKPPPEAVAVCEPTASPPPQF